MDPDSMVAAYEAELATLDEDEDNYSERSKAIAEQVEFEKARPKPEVQSGTEEPYDPSDAYLDGLERELEEVPDDRKPEVEAEIERVIKENDTDTDSDESPSDEEVEERKQARSGGKRVERATATPHPHAAPPAKGGDK